MSSDGTQGLDQAWLKSLPSSKMVVPKSFGDKLKYMFWRVYTPYHPFVRDTALSLGVVEHQGRQDYLLGKVAPHLTVEEFILGLIAKGFANHFVAWKDQGEEASLRYVEDFKWQYHVRVFEDREVRVHYEYTPEYRPISHLKGRKKQERRGEFEKMLGDIVVVE